MFIASITPITYVRYADHNYAKIFHKEFNLKNFIIFILQLCI